MIITHSRLFSFVQVLIQVLAMTWQFLIQVVVVKNNQKKTSKLAEKALKIAKKTSKDIQSVSSVCGAVTTGGHKRKISGKLFFTN